MGDAIYIDENIIYFWFNHFQAPYLYRNVSNKSFFFIYLFKIDSIPSFSSIWMNDIKIVVRWNVDFTNIK